MRNDEFATYICEVHSSFLIPNSSFLIPNLKDASSDRRRQYAACLVSCHYADADRRERRDVFARDVARRIVRLAVFDHSRRLARRSAALDEHHYFDVPAFGFSPYLLQHALSLCVWR